MKRFWIAFLCMLLLCGVIGGIWALTQEDSAPSEPTIQTEKPSFDLANVPEHLIAMWRSVDAGELDMVETINFEPNGTLWVNCTYQGADVGTIYGTYYVDGDRIHCDMRSNGAPYIVEYQFIIDGRELILQDDDGPAHYIKVS